MSGQLTVIRARLLTHACCLGGDAFRFVKPDWFQGRCTVVATIFGFGQTACQVFVSGQVQGKVSPCF